MIKIVLEPNEKKKSKLFPFPTHTPTVYPLAAANSPAQEEARKMDLLIAKRQKIIDDLNREHAFKPGDEVKCYSLETQEKFGKDLVINKIVTSYGQIKDNWPDTDVPLILHVYSRDKKMNFFCTSGYVIPKDQKEAE